MDVGCGATPEADEVVVPFGRGVVPGGPVVEVQLACLARGDEQCQRAIDGGCADAGGPRAHPLVHLYGGRVIGGLAQHLEDGPSLRGQPRLGERHPDLLPLFELVENDSHSLSDSDHLY